jgi:hypothetical protein
MGIVLERVEKQFERPAELAAAGDMPCERHARPPFAR